MFLECMKFGCSVCRSRALLFASSSLRVRIGSGLIGRTTLATAALCMAVATTAVWPAMAAGGNAGTGGGSGGGGIGGRGGADGFPGGTGSDGSGRLGGGGGGGGGAGSTAGGVGGLGGAVAFWAARPVIPGPRLSLPGRAPAGAAAAAEAPTDYRPARSTTLLPLLGTSVAPVARAEIRREMVLMPAVVVVAVRAAMVSSSPAQRLTRTQRTLSAAFGVVMAETVAPVVARAGWVLLAATAAMAAMAGSAFSSPRRGLC
jgi:hypothetical protein